MRLSDCISFGGTPHINDTLAVFSPTLSVLPLLGPVFPAHAGHMTLLLVFVGMLILLSIAALLGATPDTHRQGSPHGDFKF